MTERARPRLALGRGTSRHARPGQLMRSTLTFGMRIGLSGQNRQRYDAASGADLSGVRPPIDYWPWPETGEQEVAIRRMTTPQASSSATVLATPKPAKLREKPITSAEVRKWSPVDELKRKLLGTGLAALDNYRAPAPTVAAPIAAVPEPSLPQPSTTPPAQQVRRGLPLTPRRMGRTWAGPKTSPGGMATGATPTPTVSVAPTRFGSNAPEPLPDIVRTGIRDNPEPRPAAATTPSAPTRASAGTSPFSGPAGAQRAVPTASVSAAELAQRLGRNPGPARASSTTAAGPSGPAASIAPERPTSLLSRAVAGSAAATATLDRTEPVHHVADLGETSPVRRATRRSSRPVTADVLRSVSAPQTPGSLLSTSRPRTPRTADRLPAVDAVTADVVSAANAVVAADAVSTSADAAPADPSSQPRTESPRPGRTAEALPLAGHAVEIGSIALGRVALLDKAMADAEPLGSDPLGLADAAVLPPRTFTGRTEVVDAEPPSRLAALPLASLPRHRQRAATAAPSAPALRRSTDTRSRPPVAPGAGAETSSDAGSRPAAAHARLTRSGVGANGALTGHGRRSVSRSLDGRSVQWTAGPAGLDAMAAAGELAAAVGGDGFGAVPVQRSAIARTTATRSATTSPTSGQSVRAEPGSSNRAVAEQGRTNAGHDHGVEAAVPGVAAAMTSTDSVADATVTRSVLDEIELAAGRTAEPAGSDSHILRRALYAASEMAASLGDLAVAPPAAAGTLTDSSADSAIDNGRTATSSLPSGSSVATNTTVSVGNDPGALRRTPSANPTPSVNPGQTSTSRLGQIGNVGRDPVAPVPAARSGATAGSTSPASITQTTPPTSTPPGSTPTARRSNSDGPTAAPARPSAAQTWVPAGPGTLFSALAGPGVLQRRALLTMPDVLRRATLAQSDSALASSLVAPGDQTTGGQTALDVAPPMSSGLAALAAGAIDRASAVADVTVPAVAAPTAAVPTTAAPAVTGPAVTARRVAAVSDPVPGTVAAATAAAATAGAITPAADRSVARPLIELDDLTVAPRLRRTLADVAGEPIVGIAPTAERAAVAAPPAKPRTRRKGAQGVQAPDATAPLVDAESLAVAPRAVQRVADVPADAATDASTTAATSALSGAHPASTSTSGRPDPTNGAARVAAVDLADRFLAELSKHRQERPKPLPTQFASIADLIVGRRTPLVSTSEGSQRALAAVNKVAATTGDVIHLAEPSRLASPDAEMREIIAHELTHVAAPSAAPRFFDDDRHTAEEQRASEIGQLMRRSSAPPAGSGIARGGSTPMSSTPTSYRGSSAPSPAPSRSSASSAGSNADTIRRSLDSSAPTIRRAQVAQEQSSPTTSSSDSGPDFQKPSRITPQEFEGLLRDNFDLIVELLEDRILSDIERRGGRYRGDF